MDSLALSPGFCGLVALSRLRWHRHDICEIDILCNYTLED